MPIGFSKFTLETETIASKVLRTDAGASGDRLETDMLSLGCLDTDLVAATFLKISYLGLFLFVVGSGVFPGIFPLDPLLRLVFNDCVCPLVGIGLPHFIRPRSSLVSTLDRSRRRVRGQPVYIHKEFRRIGVTLQLLWEEYKQVFVAVLGVGNYTYAEPSWNKTLESWIGAHVRTFEFPGGVPKVLGDPPKVRADNLKSGVKQPDYYKPDVNPTYQELCRLWDYAEGGSWMLWGARHKERPTRERSG